MNPRADSIPSVSSNPSPSNSSTDDSFDLNNNISPTVIFAITLISIVLFVSALLHLLVRYLLRLRIRLNDAYEESANATALQGQLQTIFNPHDSGVDQSFIDALPLFHYKTVIGHRHDVPFDCAVCLCEFKPEDEVRILPKCSHAFHVDCIDKWLLANSTCPLCRDNLLLSLTAPSSPPLVLQLESFQDSDSHLGSTHFDDVRLNISGENDESKPENEERDVLVNLGKFNIIEEDNKNVGIRFRRCFSMGYTENVMAEDTLLHVATKKKQHFLSQGSFKSVFIREASHHQRESISTSKTWIPSIDEIRGSSGINASSCAEDDNFQSTMNINSHSFTRSNMLWSVLRQHNVSHFSSFPN